MADKKGFNLADVLKDVSKLDTPPDTEREQIEYIDIDLIDSDPGNFYRLTQLDELAANIETVGLQQPLRVRASEQDPQRVVIVSGHRRRAALAKLVKEGREDLRMVPCIRERDAGSAALRELRLIYANRDTRVISSGELAKQAERVEMLLYQLKEEGFEFPGRMRDHVAQACQISAPKLARLKVIRKQLVPEYMALFEKDKLPEQTAYALARLPAEFQKRMFSALPTVPVANAVEQVLKKYEEGWRWEPQLTCPDGKACKRGDAFLRRDCEAPGWAGFCGGKTCCLKCDRAKQTYYPCERMCSKAKAQRKEANNKKKEEEHMFLGCTSLTTAPELPATTLTQECYANMFQGCTSLTTAPELPATKLAQECYANMFFECTALETLPKLPSTGFIRDCYYQMFYGCTSIKLSTAMSEEYQNQYRIPAGGGGTTVPYSMDGMFNNTGGAFRGTPIVNTIYYTSNEII